MARLSHSGYVMLETIRLAAALLRATPGSVPCVPEAHEAEPPTLRSQMGVLAPRAGRLTVHTVDGVTCLAYDAAHARRVVSGR